MQQRHYKKAPLTEAIIDIRTVPKEVVTMELFNSIATSFAASYPKTRSMFQAKGMFKLGEIAEAKTTEQKQVGIILVSSDERTLFQSRIDGFTLNRLPPYENWEKFREEAKTLWKSYKKFFEPGLIQRLAVRYINQIQFPEPLEKFSDYFNVQPQAQLKLGRQAQFLMQIQYILEKVNAKLLLNVALLPQQQKGFTSVTLDFDIFCDQEVPQEEGEIWKFFEELRSIKNEAFEECITDKTRKLIE